MSSRHTTDSVQVEDYSDWRLEDGEGWGLENFVHTMEELEEFAHSSKRACLSRKACMVGDMEDIFDFNERLASPEYERYRSFRRLSVLDEVSLVDE